jgi:hypothetical protein
MILQSLWKATSVLKIKFRAATGHVPKIHWQISEQDALDLLTPLANTRGGKAFER